MRKLGNEFIQAFPIERGTYVSPASGMSGFNAKSRSILHAAADGNVTFKFRGGTNISVKVTAGLDLAIGHQCEYIDADCEVWIS